MVNHLRVGGLSTCAIVAAVREDAARLPIACPHFRHSYDRTPRMGGLSDVRPTSRINRRPRLCISACTNRLGARRLLSFAGGIFRASYLLALLRGHPRGRLPELSLPEPIRPDLRAYLSKLVGIRFHSAYPVHTISNFPLGAFRLDRGPLFVAPSRSGVGDRSRATVLAPATHDTKLSRYNF